MQITTPTPSYIINGEWEGSDGIAWHTELQRYPSLCFALARELAPGGEMAANVELSYQFLKHAEIGYQKELANGATFYRKAYANVCDMLNNEIYDIVREEYDSIFDDEYEDDMEDE